MAEKKDGQVSESGMDIREREQTFANFVKISAYVAMGAIVFLLFLALVNG